MQATGVLNILKAVEEEFGEKGQTVVRRAINKAGYEACQQFLIIPSFRKICLISS